MPGRLARPSLDWLLAFVPAVVAAEYLVPSAQTAIFVGACLAILPLAGWMGRATEHVAEHTGEGIGGLLNATFGNAAELIIALMALRAGLHDVVKASLTGSIIGNILLVLGASALAGGIGRGRQTFNAVAARSQATMLWLAAIALVLPAAYHHLAGPAGSAREIDLSTEIAVVLLVVYALSLVFSLRTHRALFVGEGGDVETVDEGHAVWPLGRALLVLLAATVLIAWMSEILVGTVEHAASALGMTDLFLGVIVVAIIGNAAEHSTAIIAARKNRMDLSLGIAIGSSVQIALFVAPVLVLVSHVLGPRPMDLVFSPAEVLAVVLAVAITGQIAGDGESHWLEGVQLLAVYAIFGIVFYLLPA
ncbi:MAG: calcium/proton exchanger [Acidobacteria bacterium]|nr:MAG: calcium/proton exchanger [Acidobacteriota bacterium]